MTDSELLQAAKLLFQTVEIRPKIARQINTKSRAYISKCTDLAAERIRGKKNLC